MEEGNLDYAFIKNPKYSNGIRNMMHAYFNMRNR